MSRIADGAGLGAARGLARQEDLADASCRVGRSVLRPCGSLLGLEWGIWRGENDGGDVVVVGDFAVDGWQGTEEEVADVGEDRCAPGGDAVLGQEDEEVGEDLVDVVGGLEGGELADELGGEVFGFGLFFEGTGVGVAEAGGGIRDGQAAAATSGSEVLAAGVAEGESMEWGSKAESGADRWSAVWQFSVS